MFCIQLIENGFNASKSQTKNLESSLKYKISEEEINYFQIKDYSSVSLLNRYLAFMNLRDMTENYSENTKSFVESLKGKDVQSLIQYNIAEINTFEKFFRNGLDGTAYFEHQSEIATERMNRRMVKMLRLNNILVSNNLFSSEQVKHIKDKLEPLVNLINHEKIVRCSSDNANFKKIDRQEMRKYCDSLKSYLLNNNSTKDVKQNLLNRLNTSNYREKKIIVSSEFSIKDLPDVAQSKIEEINQIIEKLNNKGDSFLSVQSVKPRPLGRGCKGWCFSTKSSTNKTLH